MVHETLAYDTSPEMNSMTVTILDAVDDNGTPLVSEDVARVLAKHLAQHGWVSSDTATEIQRRARDEGWLEREKGVPLEDNPYNP